MYQTLSPLLEREAGDDVRERKMVVNTLRNPNLALEMSDGESPIVQVLYYTRMIASTVIHQNSI